MKLIVFGASGSCGGHFVRFARANGHEVTTVVRADGDVLDAAFVARAVRGHDAIVSALGMRYAHPWARRESPDDFTTRALANIVRAAKLAGLSRVVAISAAGVGDSRPAMNWPMKVMLKTSNVGVAYADLENMEALLRESGLDWQAVRPTTLTHKPRTDRAHVTSAFGVTATIPREDVAAFMLHELESSSFTARTPMITVT
jgi:uncharacterized protein YbjT (DUF2867 family)